MSVDKSSAPSKQGTKLPSGKGGGEAGESQGSQSPAPAKRNAQKGKGASSAGNDGSKQTGSASGNSSAPASNATQGQSSSGASPPDGFSQNSTQSNAKGAGGDQFIQSSQSKPPVSLNATPAQQTGTQTQAPATPETGTPEGSSKLPGRVQFLTKEGTDVTADVRPDGTLAISPVIDKLTGQPSNSKPVLPVGTAIGTITDSGQYTLSRSELPVEQKGSIFDGHIFAVDDYKSSLGSALVAAQGEYTKKNAFEGLLPESAKLDKTGKPLDGTGVKALVYGSLDDTLIGAENVINDIAPGAATHTTGVYDYTKTVYLQPSPSDTFKDIQGSLVAQSINFTIDDLKGSIDEKHPQVINIVVPGSKIDFARQMLTTLSNPQFASLAMKDPSIVQLMNPMLPSDGRLKLAAQYMDGLFKTSPEIQTALKNWNEFTLNASKNGTVLVAGAGDGQQEALRIGAQNGEGFNVFAQSPSVISVGASLQNNTPDLLDDTMALFSSEGTAASHPTLAAPGNNVLVSRGLEDIARNGNGVTSGTYLSASQIAGTAVLMKQANPDLTSEDIKQILTLTAVDTAAPIESEGAGMVDPAAALQAAQNTIAKTTLPAPASPTAPIESGDSLTIPAAVTESKGAPAMAPTNAPVGLALFTMGGGDKVIANVLPNGTLAIPDPKESEKLDFASMNGGLPPGTAIGNITDTGQYQLNRPDWDIQQKGNLFDHQRFTLSDLTSPLGQSLVSSQGQHALKNAFNTLLPDSAKVDENGNPLDGTGIRVLIYDGGKNAAHALAVEQVFNQIAPGASTRIAIQPSSYKASHQILPQNASGTSTGAAPEQSGGALPFAPYIADLINVRTTDFKGVLEEYKPDIVNSSHGVSKTQLAGALLQQVDAGEIDTSGSSDPLLEMVTDKKRKIEDRYKSSVQYVDKLFKTSPEIQSAMKGWNDVVYDATLNGTTIVHAVGNEGEDALAMGANDGAGLVIFSLNPDVITVGASNPNSTPDLKDDTMIPTSSRGTAANPPTVAVPGWEVFVGKSQRGMAPNGNGLVTGTSFASPAMAATIAIMKQANPNLTPEDIRRIVTETAVDTDAPLEWEGSGMFDPLAALEQAKKEE